VDRPRPRSALQRALEAELAILTGSAYQEIYDPGVWEDEKEVEKWFESLYEEYGLADASQQERSRFMDAFTAGRIEEPSDWHEDA